MVRVEQNKIIYTGGQKEYGRSFIDDTLQRYKGMYSVCQRLGVDQYKSINGVRYIVINTPEGVFIIWFAGDDSGASLETVTFSNSENEAGIRSMYLGMTVNDVKLADPDGNYDSFYASWSEYPRYSTHCFANGNMYRIEYDNITITGISVCTL